MLGLRATVRRWVVRLRGFQVKPARSATVPVVVRQRLTPSCQKVHKSGGLSSAEVEHLSSPLVSAKAGNFAGLDDFPTLPVFW